MPRMRIYSVYDEKAEEFSPPFFQQNDRLAQRVVTESAKGNNNMLAAYPEDFRLYRIGDFETSTGEVSGEKQPVLIIAVKDLTKEKRNHVEN